MLLILEDLALLPQESSVLEKAAALHEPVHGIHLDIGSYGDINSFYWAHNLPPEDQLIKCNVAYGAAAPMNHPPSTTSQLPPAFYHHML
jgi:hypothetical protein